MTHGEIRMTTNAYIERLEALAPRQGLSLGGMHSASPADFALMLAAAAQSFTPATVYTEREVNGRLRAMLAGVGLMLAVDHVELRRWLVDTGVLTRDGFGRAYTPGVPSPAIAVAIEALLAMTSTPLRVPRASVMPRAAKRAGRNGHNGRRIINEGRAA